jgi:hypothetical protein
VRDMNRQIFPTLPKRNNGELKCVFGNVKGIQITLNSSAISPPHIDLLFKIIL